MLKSETSTQEEAMTSPADLPDAEPDRCATQHSTSAAPELTGPSGSAPLPPLPEPIVLFWYRSDTNFSFRWVSPEGLVDQKEWHPLYGEESLALAARAELEAEVERLRVQLAGCSVAANSNTEESQLANTIPIDSYGYSASYGDCLRASLRELTERKRAEAAEARVKELEAEIERLRGLVREYIDDFPLASLRRACSERWGLTLDEISNLEHSNNELTEQLAQWDEMGAQLESAHGMLQHELAENAIFRRRADAAETRVKELEEKEGAADLCLQSVAEARQIIKEHLGGNCTFLDDDLVRWVARGIDEIKTERDTLRTRVAELEERLMVLCVAQIKELGAAIPAQLTDEQIKRLWWDRADGQGWDGIFSFARAIVVSALGPSPDQPDPAQTKEEA